jgi:hypothetical protein
MQKICQTNTMNRSMVQFQQTTGSRSYLSHLENLVSKDLSLAQQNSAMVVCCLDLFSLFYARSMCYLFLFL